MQCLPDGDTYISWKRTNGGKQLTIFEKKVRLMSLKNAHVLYVLTHSERKCHYVFIGVISHMT